MDKQTVQVTINGKTKGYCKGITYAEIVKEYEGTTKAPIILVVVNGRLRELHKILKEDCTISFVTTEDPIGHKTYKRSASFIMLKAIYEIAGREHVQKVVEHFAIGPGYFYSLKGDVTLNQDFIDKVKEEMNRIAEAEIPIMKRSVTTDEAIDLFHSYKMYDKEKLFRYRRVSRVNIYSIGKFEDYFYGFMAHHTGCIRCFDLFLYEDGFVLLLPEAEEPDHLTQFLPSPKMFQVQREADAWADKLQIATVGDLNEKVTQQGISHVLLIQEAMQEAKISSIAEQIVASGQKKIIMIAGPSSSGKTTFSHRLSIQLAAHGMCPHPIAVDNYFVNRDDTPLDENGDKNYECLEAIDVEAFNRDMNALLCGQRVNMPEYNFKTGMREYKDNYLQLGKGDVLVIEGIHGLNDQLSHSLPKESKFKIYISALTQLNIDEHNRIPTTDGRLIRRIVRDARTRGTSAKETIAMWPSVRRGEEKNIFPYQESADVMFNSALIYELACLKIYAEPLLFQIQKTDSEYQEAKRLLKFLDYFLAVPSEAIPHNSILREFVGGSCFHV